jgi:hypothetical protein
MDSDNATRVSKSKFCHSIALVKDVKYFEKTRSYDALVVQILQSLILWLVPWKICCISSGAVKGDFLRSISRRSPRLSFALRSQIFRIKFEIRVYSCSSRSGDRTGLELKWFTRSHGTRWSLRLLDCSSSPIFEIELTNNHWYYILEILLLQELSSRYMTSDVAFFYLN